MEYNVSEAKREESFCPFHLKMEVELASKSSYSIKNQDSGQSPKKRRLFHLGEAGPLHVMKAYGVDV
jgi:hypothetical protein